jgi:hypothetical protein
MQAARERRAHAALHAFDGDAAAEPAAATHSQHAQQHGGASTAPPQPQPPGLQTPPPVQRGERVPTCATRIGPPSSSARQSTDTRVTADGVVIFPGDSVSQQYHGTEVRAHSTR